MQTDTSVSEYNRIYYREHRGEILAQKAEHRKTHPLSATVKEKQSIKSKAYYEKHREELKDKVRKYAEEHPAECKARSAAYRAKNKEKMRIYYPIWASKNQDRLKAYQSDYQRKNRKKLSVKGAVWFAEHPEKKREILRRSKYKRRALGFIPLNQPFLGCEGHHVDTQHVVYIPAELHQSIRHNVWTGWNMEKINAAAKPWMTEKEMVA